jgi:B12-binding domain/radical SAM domain protein
MKRIKNLDFLLIHPPASLGRSRPNLDADVDYTDQFISFPVGFFSLADNLEKAGFTVKILNLGERAFQAGPNFNPEELSKKFLKEFNPKIIGLDIHWMIHSAGAIKTAEIIKKLKPSIKIILGGFTASYFAEEILKEYPCIDYVMKGECDYSIVNLVTELKKDQPDLSQIPGLCYRQKQVVKSNQISVPDIKDNLEITRYDLLVDKPIKNPDRALITMFRGRRKNCCYCTGAHKSFARCMGRAAPCIINPKRVVELMEKNALLDRDKIYLYGDIRFGGQAYVEKFFKHLNQAGPKNVHVVFEFFVPATEDYLKKWVVWAQKSHSTLECTYSPESGNQKLRQQFGKGYSNEAILNHCRLVYQYKIPMNVYFMLGVPEDNPKTVDETLSLADKIVGIYAQQFKKEDLRHQVLPYTFLQIPDAGSELFHDPKKFGFKFNFQGFKELVEMLASARHWSQAIGYSTCYFSETELAKTYYYIQARILNIYKKYGLVTPKEYSSALKKLNKDKLLFKKINRTQHD